MLSTANSQIPCGLGQGSDGNAAFTTGSQIVNAYFEVTAVSSNQVTVSAASPSIGTNDLVMIYQAQGAEINLDQTSNYGAITNINNAGMWEMGTVASVASSVITLCSDLRHTYTVSGKVQLIVVPQYESLSVGASATIAATPWNGVVGGIVAMHVSGQYALDLSFSYENSSCET